MIQKPARHIVNGKVGGKGVEGVINSGMARRAMGAGLL